MTAVNLSTTDFYRHLENCPSRILQRPSWILDEHGSDNSSLENGSVSGTITGFRFSKLRIVDCVSTQQCLLMENIRVWMKLARVWLVIMDENMKLFPSWMMQTGTPVRKTHSVTKLSDSSTRIM